MTDDTGPIHVPAPDYGDPKAQNWKPWEPTGAKGDVKEITVKAGPKAKK